VYVASLQPHRQADAAILRELYLDAGMASLILREESHHHALDQLRRGADPKQAALARFEGARPFADGLGVAQEPSTALQQVLALGCQLNAAPDPIEQPYTQFGLQCMDLA